MRNISFALTTAQYLAGIKTVTRRIGWHSLKAGDVLCVVEKGQGLKRGEQVKRLGRIAVVDVRREPLRRMIDEPGYGARECALEGFPPPHAKSDPAAFVAFFCASHRRCTPATIVTRIEFIRDFSPMAS